MDKKRVGILIFPDVEVLDFCGPFEVFSVTRWNREHDHSGIPSDREEHNDLLCEKRDLVVRLPRNGFDGQPHT